MSPTRLFSPVPLQPKSVFTMDSGQARYLTRALRLRPGDSLTLFDGTGGEYPAKILTAGKSAVEVETGDLAESSTESNLSLRLLQGISKGDRFDTVVQKTTELGVQRISPVQSDYSVVKLDKAKAAKRGEHWQKIAQSACEQCGRNVVPRIDALVLMNEWFEQNEEDNTTRLILMPNASTSLSALTRPAGAVTLLIGPEGGFSDVEQEHALASGFVAVAIGPRVLRTETAAIAAITIVQTLWGDF
jgi:16S rRNA (uracil1498-N3)-methyltransferase